jgi:hypothetical protein
VQASILLAAVLATEDVSFVLVGSAALWLRREEIEVNDTDVVVEPDESNYRRLERVLEGLSLKSIWVSPSVLEKREILSVSTSFGRLDCMLERGREDWTSLREKADWCGVAGVPVLVSSLADAWALRERFKVLDE